MPNTPHTMNLYIKNIAQLVTCQGTEAKHGREAMGQIHTIEGPAAVVIRDGIITFAGRMADVAPSMTEGCRELDATGRCVLPGFVDSHTHLVFGGYREDEFQWRLAGDSYMSIMERGGGIASTMRATRAESEDELKASARRHLSNMMKMGVTTVEAKSGYGMNLETELKQLRVVRDLQDEQPLDLYSTFMGAHDTAPEYKGRPTEFIEYLCREVLPEVVRIWPSAATSSPRRAYSITNRPDACSRPPRKQGSPSRCMQTRSCHSAELSWLPNWDVSRQIICFGYPTRESRPWPKATPWPLCYRVPPSASVPTTLRPVR